MIKAVPATRWGDDTIAFFICLVVWFALITPFPAIVTYFPGLEMGMEK